VGPITPAQRNILRGGGQAPHRVISARKEEEGKVHKVNCYCTGTVLRYGYVISLLMFNTPVLTRAVSKNPSTILKIYYGYLPINDFCSAAR
jgi:hypothetical protein